MGVKDMKAVFESEVDLDDHSTGKGFLADLSHYWSVVRDVAHRTALTNAMIFGLFVGATLFSFIFRSLGGDDVVIHLVDQLGLGSWGLLILIMALVFFLGFFFDWIEITLIVLPVFAPIIAQLDFGDHVARFEMTYWFAILLAVNLQTSFLTPPFRIRLVLSQGRGAGRRSHSADLSRDHPVRADPAGRARSRDGVSRDRALASASIAELTSMVRFKAASA